MSDSDDCPPPPKRKYSRLLIDSSSEEEDTPNLTLPDDSPINGHTGINEAATQGLVRNCNCVHDQTTLRIDDAMEDDSMDISGIPIPSTSDVSIPPETPTGCRDSAPQKSSSKEEEQNGVMEPNGDLDTTMVCERCGVNFHEPCPCDDELVKIANVLEAPAWEDPAIVIRDEGTDSEGFWEGMGNIHSFGEPEDDAGSIPADDQGEIQEDLDDVPEAAAAQPEPDSLDLIEFLDPANVSATCPVKADLKIRNPFEVSLHFYKESLQGRQIHYIPREFVHQIRENEVLISRYYIPGEQLFIFPLTSVIYSTVMGILNSMGITMGKKISCDAVRALSVYRSFNHRNRVFPHPQLEVFFNSSRMADLQLYQQETVQRLICQNGRGMIAYEEGIGERRSAIAAGQYYEKEWPMLIVCAAARIEEWGQELLDVGVEQDHIQLILSKAEIPNLKLNPKVVVIGYSSLQDPEVEEVLGKFRARVLILDESHRIKHKHTKTTQAVLLLAKHARRRFLISATPAFGVPRELFFQLHVLDEVTFKHYRDFADLYCGFEIDEDGKMHVSTKWRSAKNLDELQQVILGTLVIRKFRSQHFSLPTMEREVVYLKFQPDVRTRQLLGDSCYKNSCRLMDYLERDKEHDDEETKKHKNAIFIWYKKSGWAKRIQICQYLDSIDYKRNKVIIYARHKGVREAIQKILDTKRVEYVWIRGSYEKRKDLCQEFNSNKSIRVALGGLDMSVFKIDLSAANLVVFTEISWVPDSLSRNENRSYSLTCPENASRNIQVKYLIANDESAGGKELHIDGVIWDMIGGKMEVLQKLGLTLDEDIFIHDIPKVYFRPEPSNNVQDLQLSDIPSDHEVDSDYQASEESGSEDDDDDDDKGDGGITLSQELLDLNDNSGEGVEEEEECNGQDEMSDENTPTDQGNPEADTQRSSPNEHSIRITEDEVVSEDEEPNESDEDFVEQGSDDEGSEDEDYDPNQHGRKRKRSHVAPKHCEWKEEATDDSGNQESSDENANEDALNVRKELKKMFRF